MDAAVDNMADFTGVLVGRRYKPGQKYIQLVFKTTEGLKLSLSRNLQMVRSLNMGMMYHVEGRQYQMGQKLFIHEPVATLVQPKDKTFVFRHKIVFPAVVVVSIVGAAGFFMFTRGGSAQQSETPNSSVSSQSKQASQDSNLNEASTPPTSDEPTNPAPPAASSTTKTTKKTTNGTSSTPAVNGTQSQPITPSPEPITPAAPIDPTITPPAAPTPPPDSETDGGAPAQDTPTDPSGTTNPDTLSP